MIRFLDFVFSMIILTFILPFLVPTIFLLLFTGEGKVFYKQDRVGRDGKIFGLFKFATMLEDSPNLPGGDITSGNDPRVLPLGNFLRKTKINELPQLFNIILGHISFVGPRPLTPGNFQFYNQETQDIIKDLKPGLTGIGSIIFRDEEVILKKSKKSTLDCYREDISPYKGKLEIWFSKKQTLLNYFILLLLTFNAVLFPTSRLAWKVLKDLPKPPRELEKFF